MASKEVIVTLEDGVRFIQINRPKTKNAFDSNVYETITQTLNADISNDNVVATVLTGTGEYYSSGFDIKSALKEPDDDGKTKKLRDMIQTIIAYPKLLIALVNGPAIGIAVTSAALCDIIYASDRATFETPFVRIGLCAEGCSSYTFPGIMGRSKASEMLLLGKKITAQEAHQFGFVAEVIPHQKLDEFRNELKKIGKLSGSTIMVTKKLILNNIKDKLSKICDEELAELHECFQSEEFSNAVLSFMSKKSKL